MLYRLAVAAGLICALAGTPAMAQFVPEPPVLEGRIPAPLPPPPPPPIISGPLQQAPPPGVYFPEQRDTAASRARRCFHGGRSAGLRGAQLDAYTRECVNAQ
jgi:hypothetical protein